MNKFLLQLLKSIGSSTLPKKVVETLLKKGDKLSPEKTLQMIGKNIGKGDSKISSIINMVQEKKLKNKKTKYIYDQLTPKEKDNLLSGQNIGDILDKKYKRLHDQYIKQWNKLYKKVLKESNAILELKLEAKLIHPDEFKNLTDTNKIDKFKELKEEYDQTLRTAKARKTTIEENVGYKYEQSPQSGGEYSFVADKYDLEEIDDILKGFKKELKLSKKSVSKFLIDGEQRHVFTQNRDRTFSNVKGKKVKKSSKRNQLKDIKKIMKKQSAVRKGVKTVKKIKKMIKWKMRKKGKKGE